METLLAIPKKRNRYLLHPKGSRFALVMRAEEAAFTISLVIQAGNSRLHPADILYKCKSSANRISAALLYTLFLGGLEMLVVMTTSISFFDFAVICTMPVFKNRSKVDWGINSLHIHFMIKQGLNLVHQQVMKGNWLETRIIRKTKFAVGWVFVESMRIF